MPFDDRTSLGGTKSIFPNTAWTLILDSSSSDKDRAHLVQEELCNRYWKPVYCYLRRKGYNNEDAKDLAQDFFYKILIGRDLAKKADPVKGRFRNFLLTALERFLKDAYRFKTRNKRQPVNKIFQLEDFDESRLLDSKADLTPDQAFQYAWVSELLNNILSEVKNECLSSDMVTHWQIFADRFLDPLLKNTTAPSLPQLCQKYGVDRESKASNMIITVKRRLRKAIERSLRQVNDSDHETENEISELLSFFS